MKFRYFKTIDAGTVTAGSNFEKEWRSDGNYIVKHIFLVEKTGKTLNNLTATITVEEKSYTKQQVPVTVLGADKLTALELDIPLPDDNVIKVAGRNNSSTDYAFYIVFALYTPEAGEWERLTAG